MLEQGWGWGQWEEGHSPIETWCWPLRTQARGTLLELN